VDEANEEGCTLRVADENETATLTQVLDVVIPAHQHRTIGSLEGLLALLGVSVALSEPCVGDLVVKGDKESALGSEGCSLSLGNQLDDRGGVE
jgi:hypothetical protein